MGGDVEDVQDNAAMCIGRIAKFCPGQVSLDQVYPKWLTTCFPINNDDDCSQWCYMEMIRLIQQNNQAVLGPNGQNMPKIIHWIADAAYTEMSNEEIDTALGQLLNNLKSNQAMMEGIKNELPGYLMETLQQQRL